jgi:hypothetical protein
MNAGGTAFVSAGQSAFVNRLIDVLPTIAPGVNATTVVATGATQIRNEFPADRVPGVIDAYMSGLKVAFAITIGAAGLAFVVAFFSNWRRLKVNSSDGVSHAIA